MTDFFVCSLVSKKLSSCATQNKGTTKDLLGSGNMPSDRRFVDRDTRGYMRSRIIVSVFWKKLMSFHMELF